MHGYCSLMKIFLANKENLNIKMFAFIPLLIMGNFFRSNLKLEGIKEFGS